MSLLEVTESLPTETDASTLDAESTAVSERKVAGL
jgi:hypothetical protein